MFQVQRLSRITTVNFQSFSVRYVCLPIFDIRNDTIPAASLSTNKKFGLIKFVFRNNVLIIILLFSSQ